MRRILIGSVLVISALVAATMAGDEPAPKHILTTPSEIKWGPPPPVFEPNAKFAVLSGDPGQPGLYVVRLKMPAGYKIMPHWHPTDENVTVLSGRFALGMGDKFDQAAMKELPGGGYALLPLEMRHFAMATTDATIQVHGMGPFVLTYVNPADDPSKRAASPK